MSSFLGLGKVLHAMHDCLQCAEAYIAAASYFYCPCREQNVVAIDLITQHIRMKLQQPDLRRIYHNLEVVPSNYQTRGMHTIIRDVQTNKTDFVFYADRLLRLVCPPTHNTLT